jgi:peptide/nickel transport system substrate-binding protein
MKHPIAKRVKSAHLVVIVLILLVGYLKLGVENNRKNATKKDILRIGIHSFPNALNPYYATDETSWAIANKIYDALYYFDGNGILCKKLVAIDGPDDYCWNKQKGGIEVFIRLKRGIFFSDGKELDAWDVAQTINFIKNDAYVFPNYSNLEFIKGVHVTSRFDLKLILRQKIAQWRSFLTFKILNAQQLKQATPETFRQMCMLGTGPYYIRNIKKGRFITLEINPKYKHKNKQNMFRQLEFLVVAYTQLAPLKLLNNEIDICELQPEHIQAYKKVKSWQQRFDIIKYKKFGFTYLVFNLKDPGVTQNVRNIFYNLLLQSDFTRQFLAGRGEPVTSPFLLLKHKSNPSKYQITKLENKLKLKILTNAESKIRREFVLFLTQALEPYNIKLEPLFLEYQTFLVYLKKSRFHIALSGYLMDFSLDMKDIFHSRGDFNYAHYQHLQMDKLLEQGVIEIDPQKRESIYEDANRIWQKDLPLLPLFNLYYHVGISHEIMIPSGILSLVDSNSDFLFNIHNWRSNNIKQ